MTYLIFARPKLVKSRCDVVVAAAQVNHKFYLTKYSIIYNPSSLKTNNYQ